MFIKFIDWPVPNKPGHTHSMNYPCGSLTRVPAFHAAPLPVMPARVTGRCCVACNLPGPLVTQLPVALVPAACTTAGLKPGSPAQLRTIAYSWGTQPTTTCPPMEEPNSTAVMPEAAS